MPLFVCESCTCIENTATSNFVMALVDPAQPPRLCSLCDPAIGRWHGQFERRLFDPAHPEGIAYLPREPRPNMPPLRPRKQ